MQVDYEYAAGRVSEAIDASLMARKLNRIGFIMGTFLFGAAIITTISVIISNNGGYDDSQLTRTIQQTQLTD